MTPKPTYENLEQRIKELEKKAGKRKTIEGELKKYKFMVESAHDAIFFKDIESRYIIANDKTLGAFGLSREDVIGKNDYELMPDQKEAKKNVSDDRIVFKSGKPTEVFKHMTGSDGKEYWFQAVKVPQFDNDGNVIGLVGIARDITDRKQSEKALRKSEEKYRAIFENIQDIYFESSLDGVILELSPSIESISKYKRDELIGKSVFDIYTNPDERDELIKAVLAKGKVSDYEVNLTDKDGFQKPSSVSALLVVDEQRNPLKFVGSIRDITERNQTFEALRKQKEFSEKIIETSRAIIVGLDKKHKIRIFNKGAEKITGFKSKEVIGSDWFKIFLKPETYKEMDKVWKDAWGTEFHSYVNPIRAKNGAEKIISWQTTGMYEDVDEKKHMLISIGEDITERMQAEEEIKASLKEKEALLSEIHNSEKNNFEIISSLLDMSSKHKDIKEVQDLCENARARIHSMALIHSQLYEADRFDQIDMEKHIQELVDYLSQIYERTGRRITT
ncbi:MAG: PAS domain S-box protein, partial [Deltaproteobacteria bacterium]|nr:PAS domain S-box protein [Deltaproteobacteria bacterium]